MRLGAGLEIATSSLESLVLVWTVSLPSGCGSTLEVSLGLGPVHRPELTLICEGGKMIVLWKEQRRLEGEREKGIHRKPLGHRCRRLLESMLGCFLAL